MKRYLIYILSIILLYLYVFAPPFRILPFGIDKPFIIFSLFYITHNKKWNYLINKFRFEFFSLTLILGWSFFTTIVNGMSFSLVPNDLLLLIEVIPCSYALYLYFSHHEYVKTDEVILISAIIGSFITFYLLLNPMQAYFLKTEILKYPEHLIDRFLYRGYGLSDGLLFSYPVIQGFCLSFLILGLYKRKIYYIFSIFFIVAILSNSRSGLVPIFIGLTILLIKNSKAFVKLTFVFILLGLSLFTTIIAFLEDNVILNTAVEWGMSAFNIIGDFIAGNKAENFDTLLSDMVIWPDSFLNWIIGNGKYLFTGYNQSTDVGYFLRLNYGGIIYVMLFVILMFYMAIRIFNTNRIMSLVLFSSILLLNYKADFFVVNPGSRFFFLIYTVCILDSSLFTPKHIQKI